MLSNRASALSLGRLGDTGTTIKAAVKLPSATSTFHLTGYLIMLRSFFSFGRSAPDDFIFPTVSTEEDGPDCKKDCADCTVKFPAKVKIDDSKAFYGLINEFHCHVLVATGQSDWKEKPDKESGGLMEAFGSAKSEKGVCSSKPQNAVHG